jgi:hypothetical protein
MSVIYNKDVGGDEELRHVNQRCDLSLCEAVDPFGSPAYSIQTVSGEFAESKVLCYLLTQFKCDCNETSSCINKKYRTIATIRRAANWDRRRAWYGAKIVCRKLTSPCFAQRYQSTDSRGWWDSRGGSMSNVLSLELARERAWQSVWNPETMELDRGIAINQRLLERLEAENAQLRRSVVDLMLQIQALRDGARALTA